ncbi:MAG TPA: NAD(P)-dependent oxidoreductase [Actinomycetota bacterium]|nr:NAD(P)-dependent oxidoreductase [Actinomycetota bacterium]
MQSPTPGRSEISSRTRVLLTGGTGFVGSHVARVCVAAGCDTYVLARPGSSLARLEGALESLTIIRGSLDEAADPQLLTELEPDVCIHLAWYAEPGRYLRAVPENLAALRSSLDLIEALAVAGCPRVVVAGSCAEYGQASSDTTFTEAFPVRPTTPYARAKAALFLAAQDMAANAGMGLAWARLFFLYGPWEQPQRVVPTAIEACLAGRGLGATLGEQVRDYLHVADVAEALWAVAQSPLLGPVNISSGHGVQLRAVLEAIEGAAGTPGLIRFGERPYADDEWLWMHGDNTLLRATGWYPRFTLETGIAETLAWWRSHLVSAT